MSSGPSTDDGNRKLLIEQCIEGGLIKEKESGEFSEAADPRSKFQKLMRISAREEMAMTENAQLSAYLPLRDYLKKYLFAKKRGACAEQAPAFQPGRACLPVQRGARRAPLSLAACILHARGGRHVDAAL